MSEAVDYNNVNELSAMSVLNDQLIGQKYMQICSEIQFTEEDKKELSQTITQVLEVCGIARARGRFAMHEYAAGTDNVFMKNILFLLSEKWMDFVGRQSDVAYYWVKPILLSGGLKGVEFLKAILIYEGNMMETYVGYPLELVEYRLKSLLGENTILEDIVPILKEKA